MLTRQRVAQNSFEKLFECRWAATAKSNPLPPKSFHRTGLYGAQSLMHQDSIRRTPSGRFTNQALYQASCHECASNSPVHVPQVALFIELSRGDSVRDLPCQPT